jgi:ATP-dependent exoDNAse (exonuclease V) alpha subunit
MGLEGVAGAGKIASLAAVRDAAEQGGYQVRGLAPTSRAAHTLAESGIESETLYRHLHSKEQPEHGEKRLYILDEASLAITKQMNEFLDRLQGEDRVLLVGDPRQHDDVEAGRPYQRLQEAGIEIARLDEIVRQKNSALEEAVEQLACGDVFRAIDNVDRQGRVQEIAGRDERLSQIASDYAREPQGTLVISPDNESRRELNGLIHREMQERGNVSWNEHKLRVLDSRQEMTGADRQWAGQYEEGDVVRYTRGSRVLGIEPGECARVESVDTKENLVSIERVNGEHHTYNPQRLRGAAVYQETERAFSEGDRIQFTAPSKDLHVANRQLGIVEKINDTGDVQIRTDSGREVAFNIREHPHLDYGYAMTGHSSQGQTAERVLIHVDTDQSELLINNRFAYVAVSRGQYDAEIYTNDRSELARDLSRDLTERTATESQEPQPMAHRIELGTTQPTSKAPEQDEMHGIGYEMSM